MITDKKTNSKDFPYFSFSVFCLKPSTGEETMVIFSFPVDTIPKLEKEDQENYLLLTRVVTNFCNLKGSLYSTHILCVFSLSTFYFLTTFKWLGCFNTFFFCYLPHFPDIDRINAAPLTFCAVAHRQSLPASIKIESILCEMYLISLFVLQNSFQRIHKLGKRGK